jgi:hydrogenase/urease accessory protein HupE
MLVAALAGPVDAHQNSIAHSRATVSEDGKAVDYRLLISPPDTAEALGLREDQVPSDKRINSHGQMLMNYVLKRVSIKDGERTCAVEPGRVSIVEEGGKFVEVPFRAVCPEPIIELVIDYSIFFEIDEQHTGILTVVNGEDKATANLRNGDARFRWKLGTAPPSPFWGFMRSGVDHIVFGYDHIAFLFGLLIIIAIARGPEGDWTIREFGSGLKYTGLIVTSFTVAHSITLISASMGWISLPSRLVEATIAASIVYVAIENVVKPDTKYRYVVTFVFGLIHGLGFASMLAVMLPPDSTIVPLLSFNLGVELGQLAFVLAILPLLHIAARLLGASKYRRELNWTLSGALGAFGLIWLIERAFQVTILGI